MGRGNQKNNLTIFKKLFKRNKIVAFVLPDAKASKFVESCGMASVSDNKCLKIKIHNTYISPYNIFFLKKITVFCNGIIASFHITNMGCNYSGQAKQITF